MNTSHLTPEERGTYFLLQKEWERKEQRNVKIMLVVVALLVLIVMCYGH